MLLKVHQPARDLWLVTIQSDAEQRILSDHDTLIEAVAAASIEADWRGLCVDVNAKTQGGVLR